MTRRPAALVLTLTCALAAAACENEPSLTLGPQPSVDLDILETRVRSALDTTTTDYAYVISRGGTLQRSGANGFARRPSEGGLSQTVGRRMIVFSLSKLLTTVAAMRLIDERGLTLDSAVGPWLPPGWNAPPAVQSLTFRELLTHRSGVRSTLQDASNTQSWNGMRDSLANGTPLPKTYNYQNLNFAVFQVIIPALWAGLPGGPPADIVLNQSSASFWYRFYVLTQILEPIGIDDVDCTFEDRDTATLFYRVGSTLPGQPPDDRTLWCASGGWYLSAAEYARFIAYLFHTTDLLTITQRQAMLTGHIGFDNSGPANGTHGNYYRKNGSRSIGSPNPQGGRTQVVIFPASGIEVVVFTNTRAANELNLDQLIRASYEAAIID